MLGVPNPPQPPLPSAPGRHGHGPWPVPEHLVVEEVESSWDRVELEPPSSRSSTGAFLFYRLMVPHASCTNHSVKCATPVAATGDHRQREIDLRDR